MKTRLITCVLAIFAITQLQAQISKTATPKNDFRKAFKIQPVNLIGGEFRVSYEQQISRKGSLEFETSYDNDKFTTLTSMGTIHDINARAGYRYYIIKEESKLHGLYVRSGVEGNYVFAKELNSVSTLGINAHLGYQWVLDGFVKGLTFDINVGAHANRVLNKDIGKVLGTQVDLDLNLRIGYSF